MATIVFFCIPAHGHTNPTLNVVRELTARGHRVVYYSYDDFREKIEGAGAEFVSCNGYDAQLGLTRERVRQIREKSIAKLRDSGNAKILMKYLG